MRRRTTARIEDLVASFVEAARKQGAGIESGDSHTANKWYRSIVAIRKQLLGHGKSGEEAMLQLIENDDAYVRLWAASSALTFSPLQAQPALERLATREGGFLSFTAAMTLSEWRKHN